MRLNRSPLVLHRLFDGKLYQIRLILAKHAGDPSEQELEFLEIFCNPNAAATAFDAKALITIKTKEGVRITTEGRISSLKEDLDSYMTQHA